MMTILVMIVVGMTMVDAILLGISIKIYSEILKIQHIQRIGK